MQPANPYQDSVGMQRAITLSDLVGRIETPRMTSTQPIDHSNAVFPPLKWNPSTSGVVEDGPMQEVQTLEQVQEHPTSSSTLQNKVFESSLIKFCAIKNRVPPTPVQSPRMMTPVQENREVGTQKIKKPSKNKPVHRKPKPTMDESIQALHLHQERMEQRLLWQDAMIIQMIHGLTYRMNMLEMNMLNLTSTHMNAYNYDEPSEPDIVN